MSLIPLRYLNSHEIGWIKGSMGFYPQSICAGLGLKGVCRTCCSVYHSQIWRRFHGAPGWTRLFLHPLLPQQTEAKILQIKCPNKPLVFVQKLLLCSSSKSRLLNWDPAKVQATPIQNGSSHSSAGSRIRMKTTAWSYTRLGKQVLTCSMCPVWPLKCL